MANAKELELFDCIEQKLYKFLVSPEQYQKVIAGDKETENLAGSSAGNGELNQTPDIQIIDDQDKKTEQDNQGLNQLDDELNEPDITATLNVKWSHQATLGLINAMDIYYSDLAHPKKKRHVWENVANHISNEYSPIQCQSKWKSLVRTYKGNIDKASQTGQGGGIKFIYFWEIDNILGDKPSMRTGKHTLETSFDINKKRTEENDTDKSSNDTKKRRTWGEMNKNNKENQPKNNKQSSSKDPKQVRHEERVSIEKQKIELEKKKLELLGKLIDKIN